MSNPSHLARYSCGQKTQEDLDGVAPRFLFWILWWERKRVAFENEAPCAHRMKANFLTILWSWATMYSVDNTNSLMDFLGWLGCK